MSGAFVEEKEAVLEQVLDSSAESVAPNEVILGRITRCDNPAQPIVSYQVGSQFFQQNAITTQPLADADGKQVALMFVNGDMAQPIIMGLVRNPLDDAIEGFEFDNSADESVSASEDSQDLTVDGKKVVIEGKDEVVLKCGNSSITLTKSGKIMLRGKYLVSRASGVNRILGGSVQVN